MSRLATEAKLLLRHHSLSVTDICFEVGSKAWVRSVPSSANVSAPHLPFIDAANARR